MKWIWILLLCLPVMGMAQRPVQLSCQIKTGRLVLIKGDIRRTYVWVKIGKNIKYYGIGQIAVIDLPKKIENEKIKQNKSDRVVRLARK